MPAQRQMSIRFECEITLEIRRKGCQSSLLAGQLAAFGMLCPWLSGREEDAVQC